MDKLVVAVRLDGGGTSLTLVGPNNPENLLETEHSTTIEFQEELHFPKGRSFLILRMIG